MLGHRNPQRSLFEAQAWPHRVPADSFYARLGAVIEHLFVDDDFAELYCSDNGRPSLPPSLLSGILLLQFYDDVSDAEAIARLAFDLRWKVALTLGLDFDPPHSSSLSVFSQPIAGAQPGALRFRPAVGRGPRGRLPAGEGQPADRYHAATGGRCSARCAYLHPHPQGDPAGAESGRLPTGRQAARPGDQPGGLPGQRPQG
jgi:hypothetical protein